MTAIFYKKNVNKSDFVLKSVAVHNVLYTQVRYLVTYTKDIMIFFEFTMKLSIKVTIYMQYVVYVMMSIVIILIFNVYSYTYLSI